MPVFKIHHNSDFTTISNNLIRDTKLSNQALGLMVKMLSFPPNWNYSIEGLASISKDGRGRITSALEELKQNNYLIIKQARKDGKISGWEYHIYEEPSKEPNQYSIEETINESTTTEADPIITPTKKEKNPDEVRHSYGEFKHVKLSNRELNKLQEDFGISKVEEYIKKLDEGIELKGYKYKNCNLAMRKWMESEKKNIGVNNMVKSWQISNKTTSELESKANNNKLTIDKLNDIIGEH